MVKVSGSGIASGGGLGFDGGVTPPGAAGVDGVVVPGFVTGPVCSAAGTGLGVIVDVVTGGNRA